MGEANVAGSAGVAVAAAGAATADATVSPPTAKPYAANDGSDNSDPTVGAPSAAGTPSGAAGGTTTTLSISRAAANSISAQSALTLSGVADGDKHSHAGSDISAPGGNTADAAGAAQVTSNSAPTAAAAAAPSPTLRIHASIDGADFAQGLSDRVSWMVDNGVNGAKLQVNPPQLGPIELRISVQGDHAQVWMTTHSAVARDALELSSPKLREMLGAQGFGQVSVDISQRSFQDRPTYAPPYERASSADRTVAATPTSSTTANSTPRTALGALDAYA